MKSVNSIISSNKKSTIALEKSFVEAQEKREFRELISLLKTDKEILMKYTSSLEESACEFENCKKCKGLLECKNKVNGYCYVPKVDGNRISFSYVACKYKMNEAYHDNILLFDIPKSIKNASLSDIYKDKNRIDVIKKMKSFLNNYDNNREKAIYLHGSFGCGKTYLIAALFNEFAKKNIKGVVVHVPELLRGLKESFSSDYSEKFALIKKTPLLLLDDIGAEYLTAWGRDEVLEPILQYRMDEGLPTFFTSNFNLEELEKHLCTTQNSIDKVKARRIIERINQLSEPIELVSKNFRNEN